MNMDLTAHSAQTETRVQNPLSPKSKPWASISGSYNPDAELCVGYQPMPAGEYALEIVEADYVPTKTGTGMILKTKAQIVGGGFACRPYYINYTLEHENDQARLIGQRDFAGLRRATGVLAPEDTSELLFQVFKVKIGVKARKDTGEMENIIRQYLFEDGAWEAAA